jgi:inhibitor of KinA
MIGFAPGFPYLGGMYPQIAAPRKNTPRTHIPAGSIGIAGTQTGIYPIETPGGWQLIGRTPLMLFDPRRNKPSLLAAGDKVRFVPINREEYNQRKEHIREH